MRILVLGGTLFVGRHLVEAALQRGHQVTLFNRGRTGPGLYPEAESLRGDRDGDLSALEGRTWDAVLDPSGYVPRVVRRTAEALAGRVGHYGFVSTMSVYAGFGAGAAEDAELAVLEDPASENVQRDYGALKAACERVLEEMFPGRVLQGRAGLIVGPHDRIYRFPYWLERIAAGGVVLAPGSPEAPLQIIDARDLADWMVAQAEAGTAGVFNLTGPEAPLRFGGVLEAIRDVQGSDARFVWVDDAFLHEQGIQPVDGASLWLPLESWDFCRRSVDGALRAGLVFRPLRDTILQTWQALRRDGYTSAGKVGVQLKSGLPAEREQELLALWLQRQAESPVA